MRPASKPERCCNPDHPWRRSCRSEPWLDHLSIMGPTVRMSCRSAFAKSTAVSKLLHLLNPSVPTNRALAGGYVTAVP